MSPVEAWAGWVAMTREERVAFVSMLIMNNVIPRAAALALVEAA